MPMAAATPIPSPVVVLFPLVVLEVELKAAVDPGARPIFPKRPDVVVASRPKEVASLVLEPSHPRDVGRVKLCEDIRRGEMLQ